LSRNAWSVVDHEVDVTADLGEAVVGEVAEGIAPEEAMFGAVSGSGSGGRHVALRRCRVGPPAAGTVGQ
jgi:hypothetical protein